METIGKEIEKEAGERGITGVVGESDFAGTFAIMRRLQRTDWAPHLSAVVDAVRAGEKLYLIGEDLNVDPVTGLKIDPLAMADPNAFLANLAKAKGVRRQQQGGFDIISIGKGALIAGTATVDRAIYHSSDFVPWHENLKKSLGAIKVGE